MQPVGALGQILAGQTMTRSRVSPSRDNLHARNDFPAQRERGGLAEFGLARAGRTGPPPPGPATGGVRRTGRASRMIFSAACIRHMAVTLTVQEFGLDSEVLWLW